MSRQYRVAVAGATGAVGQQMVACLEERNFPVGELKPLASERSLGKTVTFKGQEVPVEVLTKDSFQGIDLALSSAGGSISREFGPIAAQAGAVVVDNSSAWRMDPDVPLVVPEVNPKDIGLYKKTGIIANPNCSTIQMVVVQKADGFDWSAPPGTSALAHVQLHSPATSFRRCFHDQRLPKQSIQRA